MLSIQPVHVWGMGAQSNEGWLITSGRRYKMERNFVGFGFTMSPEIPRETALEIVALKQVLLSIIGKLPPETRREVLTDLKSVDSEIMRDIVKNVELISK
jgi:hypothetical protein